MDLGRYGPWALVIGGSEGIGEHLARKLAAAGFKLALVARKPAQLQSLAKELRQDGAQVRTVVADMSAVDALERVRTITDDIEVGLLAFVAGANSVRGNFVELEPEVYRSVINVNVLAQCDFSHHYGMLMRSRGRGGIILTGSRSGYIGSASLATYCGVKAFSRVFSEALWAECEEFGVDVLHLVVSFTATPAMGRLGYDLSSAQSPEEVAQEALDNIANGPIWICGGPANAERCRAAAADEPRADTVRAAQAPPRLSAVSTHGTDLRL